VRRRRLLVMAVKRRDEVRVGLRACTSVLRV
jgi:hypothetical protein